MNELEIFRNLSKKIESLKKSNYNINFIPRQTISININNEKYYISLICDKNWQVQVVILDKNNNIVYKILELDGDRASITKLQNNLYVFTDSIAYIFDINNFKIEPLTVNLGNLDLQGISANDNNIFAYSIAKDRIIKYDKNLVPIEEYENRYSNKKIRMSLELACNQETFFSIPMMVPTEEQYLLMKKFIQYYINSKISEENDQIHSCSFNNDENTLYITMYNLIWVIKNETEFSYLYFKDKAITTALYDNDLKKLIINFGSTKGNHLSGSIVELSNDEIKKKAIKLTSISSTFKYSKNLESPSTILLNSSTDEINSKKSR